MMRIESRLPRGGALVAAALCLLVGCHPATAQDGAADCGPPPPWTEAAAKPGQPQVELAACLKHQAYQIRNLTIPIESATAGIVAQCEVPIDRLEGHAFASAPDAAADQAALAQARADVAQYRRCPGR